MSTDSAKNECLALMIASQDSTAAFVAAIINNLIQNPHSYTRLEVEMHALERAHKLSSPVVKFAETNQMPFFLACTKETLRFAPSTPIVLPRYVSKGGMVLNGIFVPEKTEIGANPYIIHRDKAVFGDDADIFRPERWLEDPDKVREMDKYTLAWGYGARKCLGKNIAQLETHKLLVQVYAFHVTISLTVLTRFREKFLRGFKVHSFKPKHPWKEANWAIAFYFEHWMTIEVGWPTRMGSPARSG